jgi:hypothetical protein
MPSPVYQFVINLVGVFPSGEVPLYLWIFRYTNIVILTGFFVALKCTVQFSHHYHHYHLHFIYFASVNTICNTVTVYLTHHIFMYAHHPLCTLHLAAERYRPIQWILSSYLIIFQQVFLCCLNFLRNGTHSQYVILIVFPRQQMSRERALMLHFKHTSCFVCVNCITFNTITCDRQVRVMCNISLRINCSDRDFFGNVRLLCISTVHRSRYVFSLSYPLISVCSRLLPDRRISLWWPSVGTGMPSALTACWNLDFTCLMFSHWTLQNVTCDSASRTGKVWCRLCSDMWNSSWVPYITNKLLLLFCINCLLYVHLSYQFQ